MFTFSVIRVCLCSPCIISRTGPCFNSSVVLTNHIQRRETSFWLKPESIFLVFTVWEQKSAWNAVGWLTLMVVVPAFPCDLKACPANDIRVVFTLAWFLRKQKKGKGTHVDMASATMTSDGRNCSLRNNYRIYGSLWNFLWQNQDVENRSPQYWCHLEQFWIRIILEYHCKRLRT